MSGFNIIYTAKWIDREIESIDFIKRKGMQLVILKNVSADPMPDKISIILLNPLYKFNFSIRFFIYEYQI